MDLRNYYILDGHEPVRTTSIEQWGRFMEDHAKRRVAFDKIDDIHVSTVFLGLDHRYDEGPPLVFETMIFGGKHDGYCERYATWDEAEAGHKVALALAKEL